MFHTIQLNCKTCFNKYHLGFSSLDIYNVVNKDGLVGCFILFKSAYRIGDEILGIFDFRECKVKCTKVTAEILTFIQLLANHLNINRVLCYVLVGCTVTL